MTSQRLVPSIGHPSELLRRHDLFKKSCDFFDAHYADLLRRYPDEWIGIFDGEVCAHAADMNEMLGQLDALGIPRATSYTEFLATQHRIEIL
jgi:hypothetical protein